MLAAALACAPAAVAHGDPTAHYLETDSFLTSYAAPVTLDVELRLRGLLDATERNGYPIRVALIANLGDTGGDPAPFDKPHRYAAQIAAEIESMSPLRGPVLIVGPQRIAIAGNQLRNGSLRQIRAADERTLLRGVPLAGEESGDALAFSAMRAVRQLARAAGKPLPSSVPPARHNPYAILGRPAPEDGVDPWLVAAVLGGTLLLLGAVLVAVQRRASRTAASPPAVG